MGAPVLDNRLMELHFGDWEMRAWDDIPREIFDVWAHDYANLAPPNGETFSQLQQRGLSFLDEILQQHAGKNIVVVTHGGLIRALLAHVLNMELKGLFRFNIDHASITELDFSQAVPKINFVNL
jgi:alpha-ribazole phosphatase